MSYKIEQLSSSEKNLFPCGLNCLYKNTFRY